MLNRTRFTLRPILLAATAFIFSVAAQAYGSKKYPLPVGKVKDGLSVMMLGSGGPVATSKRVSADYLIFTDRTPRLLIDAGGGVFQRIGKSGAKIGGIESILLTHLHMDHVGGLTPILAMSFFHNMAAGVVRNTPYKFVGPAANAVSPFPSTTAYMDGHFSPEDGLERYLAGFPPALGVGVFRYETQDVPAATTIRDASYMPLLSRRR